MRNDLRVGESLGATKVTIQKTFSHFFEGATLSPDMWHGSFNGRESSIQQLSPYVGKMKSGMARSIILAYSRPGNVVLDPFSGSGVVPYEAAILGRNAIGNDLNPYAYVLSQAKLTAPRTIDEALGRLERHLGVMERTKKDVDLDSVPAWVREFFHPDTLREALALFKGLRGEDDYFLEACFLGILHHVRPGFLSYPSSHLVPYLRVKKYPPSQYPEMYAYRDVRSRMVAKVQRAFRRAPGVSSALHLRCLSENSMYLPGVRDGEVDLIASSPPYYGALDYGRDNRLRLWFIGVEDYKEVDAKLTSNERVYVSQMTECIKTFFRVLRPGGYMALVLGDYHRNGRRMDSADTIAHIVEDEFGSQFPLVDSLVDEVPDDRRTRRKTRTTLAEQIIVFRKASVSLEVSF